LGPLVEILSAIRLNILNQSIQQTLSISIYPDLAASTDSLVPRLDPYMWRRLVLRARVDTWSLTSLQQRRAKPGGRLVKHARYYWQLLAEGRLTRRLVWQRAA
jgi:hypothetical protein